MRKAIGLRRTLVVAGAAMLLVLAAACGETKVIEVPGETVIKEVVQTVEVPGQTVIKEVVKTVEVPGQTVIKEVVKTVKTHIALGLGLAACQRDCPWASPPPLLWFTS